MGTAGSTVVGVSSGRVGDLRRSAARLLGGVRIPHADAAALLLPMVRRAVRTKRGPVALVSWLGSRPAAVAGDAAALADGLARLLTLPIDTRGGHASTLRPAPGAT